MSVPSEKISSNNLHTGVCHFTYPYKNFDGEEEKEILFGCEENIIGGQFCIFHDPFFWQKHPEVIINSLQEKISKWHSNGSSSSLYCIGYHIPSTSIIQNFSRNVYFTNSEFHGEVSFEGSNFVKADFSKSKFDDKASFNKCKFRGRVSFEGSNFVKADFSKSKFDDKVDFNTTRFLEASFVDVVFDHGASFKDVGSVRSRFSFAQFLGDRPSYFINCRFEDVKFNSCNFDKGVSFRNVSFGIENTIRVRGPVKTIYESIADGPNETVPKADFAYCRFNDLVFYTNVNFHCKVQFNRAHFHENALVTFNMCKFHRETNFSYASFDADLHCRNSIFYEEADFSNIECGENSFENLEKNVISLTLFSNKKLSLKIKPNSKDQQILITVFLSMSHLIKHDSDTISHFVMPLSKGE